MFKIAITTMTGSANYGNALQNYAVLELIRHCGYEAETLRITTKNGYPDAIPENVTALRKLRPSYMLSWYRSRCASLCGAKNDADLTLFALRRLKANAGAWREAVRKKQEVFTDFQNTVLRYTDFPVSNRDFNLPALRQYDAFVTGSDQVWNPYYRTNSMVEFLQMAPEGKRIALAPSFGVQEIPDCRKREYARWLREIPYLSVRETEGAEIIRNLTGREAQVLLDPTFGLTKEEWLAFAARPEEGAPEPDSYVFCYFLGNRTSVYTKFIKQYAKKHSCAIIDVYDVSQPEHYARSPREFVLLLANARAVFTDSFHGCAFAINLQKPFVVFDRAGDGCIVQSSRITTVLGKTGLEGRRFGMLSADEVDSCPFEQAAEAVAEERKKLRVFLKNSLNSAVTAKRGVKLAEIRHCTGCGACMNACSRDAITMQPDEEGFLYPVIDYKKCVNCHACEKVCPADRTGDLTAGRTGGKTGDRTVNRAGDRTGDCLSTGDGVSNGDGKSTKAYFAYSGNDEICRNSSSGGVFSELAASFIARGGIVFGAGYDQNFSVRHMSAETPEELTNLRTSKYVQSDTGSIFTEVRNRLQAGRQVLFSGTPCQVAALRSFLGRDYDNLILVDIICHGVPSPALWKAYLEQEHGSKKIKSVSFRNKDLGWNDFSMKIEYADGTFYRELAVKDPFESAFLANLTLRPICYQCQYKTVDRVSDLTIADYWGVETVYPELKDQQGVSLVLTHSTKGEALLHDEVFNLTLGETDLNRAVGMNSGCTHSVPWPPMRNRFFELCKTGTVKEASTECQKLTTKQKLRKSVVFCGVRVKRVLRKAGMVK